ncbi:MAG: hypothetical protein AB7S26_00060 [Sandaracinaceae bacterium]
MIEHDSGANGLPEQRRLPEGFGLEMLGGLIGLLGTVVLLPLHRLTRRPTRIRTTLRFDGAWLVRRRGAEEHGWDGREVTDFGSGRDTPERRTVFMVRGDAREVLLDGLTPHDAARAVELLHEVLRTA